MFASAVRRRRGGAENLILFAGCSPALCKGKEYHCRSRFHSVVTTYTFDIESGTNFLPPPPPPS